MQTLDFSVYEILEFQIWQQNLFSHSQVYLSAGLFF